jgi:hypothetical protein
MTKTLVIKIAEAERKNFRYFLEVFNPNIEPGIAKNRTMMR